MERLLDLGRSRPPRTRPGGAQVAGCLAAALAVAGCGGPPAAAPASAVFVERAAALGIDFAHVNGMTGRLYMAEVMGSGAALADFDGDGDLDLFLVQGGILDPASPPAPGTYPGPPPPRGRLYRNELVPGGTLRFADVTEASGLAATGYGMGAAVGDYDDDGDPDLYLTAFGPNQLWRNEGGLAFTEVTAASGTDDPRWSTAAVWFDYDLDGRLDLYVGNYVDFTLASHKDCYAESSLPDYCGPLSYRPYPDRLFRNRGDGTFEDVSASSGIAAERGSSLGAVAADFDEDGRLDLYVANDALPNFLWLNQGDGTFRNEAMLAGCAVDLNGKAQGSMGVDAGDFDGDGDLDLFMTHILEEVNTLYRTEGGGQFTDASFATGIGPPSRGRTGFGTAFFDYDGDGWLDLLVANGDVRIDLAQKKAGDPYPLRQPNQLFRNLGNGRFAEVGAALAGDAFAFSEVSRGAAFGDLDEDGDTDVVVTQSNGPVRLLVNQVGNRNPWLGLRLLDRAGGRDAYGAQVAVELEEGRVLWRRVRADGSFLSASDPRVLVGLGPGGRVRAITVVWPGGLRERWGPEAAPAGRYSVLVRGTGRRAG